MTILRKPATPCIDETDPWKDDPFERKAEGEMLANLIASSIEVPLVVSLQSPWGSGKTVFLKRLAFHMKASKGIPTIRIDAWKTDDCADPLVAILAELSLYLEAYKNQEKSSSEKVENCISRLAKFGSKILLPTVSIVADLNSPGSGETIRSAGSVAENLLEMQKNRSAAERDFREVLLETRRLVTGRGRDRSPSPILLIIDELDRCRPDHAIRTLERIKHYFDVPGISFLIATDRGNLPAAVKSVYGVHVDGELYLRKFFDYEFHLHPPTSRAFAANLVHHSVLPDIEPVIAALPNVHESQQLGLMLQVIKNGGSQTLKAEYMDAFPAFSDAFSLTLRDQEQAMTMISAFVHTRKSERDLLPAVDCFLACLRFGHPTSFKALTDGIRSLVLKSSTDEIDQAILSRLKDIPHWAAVSIVLGSQARVSFDRYEEPESLSSKLIKRYQTDAKPGAGSLVALALAARLHQRQFDFYSYASSFVRLASPSP